MTAPEKLSAYIKSAKMRQVDFADMAKLTPPMLSMVLSGRRRPGRDAALNIEMATGGKVPARLWSKTTLRRAA